MKIIEGVYTTAKIMTDDVEDYATSQIKSLCDNPVFTSDDIVCMPDIHPGKVSTIGFTSTIKNIYNGVMPIIIGNDIGCGILAIKLKDKRFEPLKLDKVIMENIPSGFNHHHKFDVFNKYCSVEKFTSDNVRITNNILLSFGTLGGGNHFIELDKDPEDNSLWLLIHTGSRSLGSAICDTYLNIARKKRPEVPYELGVIFDKDLSSYLDDCRMANKFAMMNRSAIADTIIKKMKWHKSSIEIDTMHNMITTEENGTFIRKGSIQAHLNQDVVIPINARDGVIVGTGKGNPEWNYSAPHGAGRILNRSDVKTSHTLSEYKKIMKGIYSPSINNDTLDEAPFAYRSIEQILPLIEDTITVHKVLKPVYNYKAGSKER